MTDTLIPDREQAASELADLRLRTDLFIDGDFRPARDGRRFVTENPATGRVDHRGRRGRLRRRGRGGRGGPIGIRARRLVTDGSRRAEADPARLGRPDRAHARELGLIETIDAGKPITDTVGLDMPETAACIRWHAEAIDKLYGQVAPSPEGTVATITREPVGVVGAVVPWNYPAQMAAWKLGPALATGNSVVIKPASTTSLSLLRIAELGAEAGIPDGVLNVVTGPGDTVGAAIGRHPDIDCRRLHGLDRGRPALPGLVGGVQPQARAARARRQEPADRVRRRDRHGATSRPTPRSRSSGTWARTAAPGRA